MTRSPLDIVRSALQPEDGETTAEAARRIVKERDALKERVIELEATRVRSVLQVGIEQGKTRQLLERTKKSAPFEAGDPLHIALWDEIENYAKWRGPTDTKVGLEAVRRIDNILRTIVARERKSS